MVPSDRRTQKQLASRDPVARELGWAQAEIMNVFWHKKSATVPELLEAINKKRAQRKGAEIAYTTVLTFVQRLHRRGLLERVPEGRGFRYTPTQTREELLESWSDQLIDRLLSDFGEIAVARLDDRLRSLDSERKQKLREARRSK
jgi:predicted transcriptional regulator